MKRGEIWTVADGPDYTSKPRPVVILQNNLFSDLDSVTVCPLTSTDIRASPFRVPVYPTGVNGLRSPCWLMVDKIATSRRTKLGARIGLLETDTLTELNRAVIIFLHLDGGGHTPARRR